MGVSISAVEAIQYCGGIAAVLRGIASVHVGGIASVHVGGIASVHVGGIASVHVGG